MAIGTGSGPNKVQQAIEKALHHPLLEDIDMFSATGMIANFTGSSSMSFKEVTDALQTLQQATGFHADIIPGLITDQRMEDRVQLILIVTGIGLEKAAQVELNKPAEVYQAPTKYAQPQSFQQPETVLQPNPKELNLNNYTPHADTVHNLDVPAFLRRRQTSGGK